MTDLSIIAMALSVVIICLIILVAWLVKNTLQKKTKEFDYIFEMNREYAKNLRDMNDRVMAFFPKAFDNYKVNTEIEPPPGGDKPERPENPEDEGHKISLG